MRKTNIFIYYIIEILFLELLFKYIMMKNIFNIGLLYTLVFTIPIALFLSLISNIFKKKTNKIITIVISIIIALYFEFQFIFYKLFSVPFSFSTIELANQAFDFTNIIKDALLANWFNVLLILLPSILLIIFSKQIEYKHYNKYQNIALILLIIFSLSTTYVFLLPEKEEFNSPYNLYFKNDNHSSIIDTFGLLTYTRIDIKRVAFGYKTNLIEKEVEEVIPPTIEEITYGPNILNIDFENLAANESNETLKAVDNYFANVNPSYKNEYTGMFAGKNLIFILAEGFNEVAVDSLRTPTLYKLINEGFNFTNFYSPVFLSTTGGEFQATTGLIPTQEILKTWKNKNPTMLYSIGHSFNGNGYNVFAYHDWTYTYYKRQATMKTLGFNNYMGCGNGMEKLLKCDWLPSDIEMVNQTAPLYLNQEKFATYYVTVSGHSPYEKGANIVAKNYSTVKDLNISYGIKNYLSSQVELDRAVEALIKQLEIAGKLDNTVIALVGDHYPYTLSIDEMNEVSTYKKDEIVEVNHSNFIIWNNNMIPVVIDKVGSQIDVLPTLLNLFGINYDSRLIMGKDILSTHDGLAIFSNRSWVSDKGTYFSATKKFIPKEGCEVTDTYIEQMNKKVSNAFTMSKLIIDNDYYTRIRNSSN